MKIGNFVSLAVGVVLVVMVILSVVAPLTVPASTTTVIENEGARFAAPDDETHVIAIDTTGAVTVDGEAYDISESFNIVSENDPLMLVADSGFITIPPISGGTGYLYVYSSSTSFVKYTVEGGATITIENGAATVANSETTVTLADVRYYVSDAGEYSYTTAPTVAADTELWAVNHFTLRDNNGTKGAEAVFSGTTAAFDSVFARSSSGSSLVIDVTSTASDTEDLGNDMIKLNSSVLGLSSGNFTGTVTITNFIVPHEYEIGTPGESTLTSTIAQMLPVLMLVGVLVFVASTLASNRRV